MRRRRQKRQLHTVSLFPFLAVLICTFGVLIILLVIVVKAADQQAIDSRSAQNDVHELQVDDIRQELELQQIRRDALLKMRPAVINKLQDEKNRRAHIQADISRLSDELILIKKELQLVESKTDSAPNTESDLEIAALEQQLANESELLAKRRTDANQNTETKYSVVPFDGPGGTKRRPIYVECRENELTIQPYGIVLQRKDFVRPILPNNPLDAALIAVREYFLKNDLSEIGGTPYPLLIVRPDGPNAYAMARHAMKSWDEEFGYELIPANRELDFGEKDPQLEEQLRLAVDAAIQRQQEYVASQILNRGNDHSSVQPATGFQASSQFGGFVSENGRVQTAAAKSKLTGQGERTPNRTARSTALAQGTQTGSTASLDADIAIEGMDAQGKSIAEEKGKDWGLPSKSEGAVAYRRPIKIELSNQVIVINSDARSNQNVVLQFKDDLPKTAEELVEAIWRRIETWGVAGVGGYWKPELDIVVLPGAEGRYQSLRRLLDNSGIELLENRR